MASDVCLRTTRIMRQESHCSHFIDYSFLLAASDLLYVANSVKLF